MFYYPAVLNRHSGCFSTIWLAATKGIKITRRDYLKVNIKRTCDDIIDYVMVRVPPPRPGLPRPRFSLYLSSQLQYGVIIIYHHQCIILLEEIQTILEKLAKKRTFQMINIDVQDRGTVSFPDALALLEEADWAEDPFFGEMHSWDALPSPSALIQFSQEFLRGLSPEHSPLTSPASPLQDGLTAAPGAITLPEQEPVTIPTAGFEGMELVHDPGMIELLISQSDDFPEVEVEKEREGERREVDVELEREKMKAFTESIIESQPTTPSSKEATMQPLEVSGLPTEKPASPAEERTPVSVPMPLYTPPGPDVVAAEQERRRKRPSPTLEELSPPGRQERRRRRRQLVFMDPQTQLSQEFQQQQINNPLTETRELSPPPSPSQRMLPPAHLLSNPCTFLPEEIMLLWKQTATITPLSVLDLQVGERGPDSTDLEGQREGDREAEERESDREAEERERQEPSYMEVPREQTVSDWAPPDVSGDVLLPLEVSGIKDVSRDISPLDTSQSRGSPVSRPVSKLESVSEVGEVPVELEGEAEQIPVDGLTADVPGSFAGLAEHDAPFLFHSLLPPQVDRRTVTNTFWSLLVDLSVRKLCVEQDQPYGDIRISPGPNFV